MTDMDHLAGLPEWAGTITIRMASSQWWGISEGKAAFEQYHRVSLDNESAMHRIQVETVRSPRLPFLNGEGIPNDDLRPATVKA